MEKTYLGVDNGCTGSMGIIYPDGEWHYVKTPVKKDLNYTKTKQFINRIDHTKFYNLCYRAKEKAKVKSDKNILVLLERPMINPTRWKATQSALRAIESQLVMIESLLLPYQFIDSKEWQKEMLPKGVKKEQLKIASTKVAERLFPKSCKKMDDGDGILIAEFARRKKL